MSFIYKYKTSRLTPFGKPLNVLNLAYKTYFTYNLCGIRFYVQFGVDHVNSYVTINYYRWLIKFHHQAELFVIVQAHGGPKAHSEYQE